MKDIEVVSARNQPNEFLEFRHNPNEDVNLSENSQQSNNHQQVDALPHSAPTFGKNPHRVELNPVIIKTILQQSIATDWESSSHEPYALNILDKQSTEYKIVENLFKVTAEQLIINKVERVENPYLLGQYLLKKEKMERENVFVQEKSLFHGTRKINIDSICRNNFDWRRYGRSRGHLFGQGVNFSPQVSHARHYTNGDNVMFLAKVLVSKVTKGSSTVSTPPEPFDTTMNQNGQIIVKYEDDDFYPQYVISYRHQEQKATLLKTET